MISIIIKLISIVPSHSREMDRAKGRYKYPETWAEFKRYIQFKINNR